MINPYFAPNVKSEQDLHEALVIESIQMHGTDAYYIPRESQGYDKIWSDDILPKYDDAYKLEMYLENTEGFDGEGDLFSKFGIEIRDAATFIVSRRRFKKEVSNRESEDDAPFYRPREGDLIYLPMSQSTFQIMRTETEDPFFALYNLPIFKMSCELYEYSNETFDTGIEEIDRVEESFAYQYVLTMPSTAVTYIDGETVSQTLSEGVTMSGKVVKVDNVTHQIYVAHAGANDGKYHEFVPGIALLGLTSFSQDIPVSVVEENNMYAAEMNQDFQDEANTFVDFTPTNPFGS
jgi:hypothetical protein